MVKVETKELKSKTSKKPIKTKKVIKKEKPQPIKKASPPQKDNQEPTQPKKTKKKQSGRFFTKSNPNQESSVIYIGHLPYGFVEEGLTNFFQQFGEIKRVKLARSKKTARSKGYGFIEFELPEVAEIAAETINGYFLESRQLICEKLRNLNPNPFDFPTSKKYKFIPWKKIYIKQKNSLKSDEQIKMHINQLLKNEQQKKEKIKALGIDYDFPGFDSIIKSCQPSQPQKKTKKKK